MEGNQDPVARRIRDSLQHVEKRVIRLRKRNSWLMVSGVVTSSVATLITGVTAAIGPIVGEGTSGWRLACAVGAAFAFLSAVTVGLDRRLQTTGKLATAHQALGRLRFLDIAADTGSRTREEITKEYEEIFKAYPEIVA
jgi:hypothetical protein